MKTAIHILFLVLFGVYALGFELPQRLFSGERTSLELPHWEATALLKIEELQDQTVVGFITDDPETDQGARERLVQFDALPAILDHNNLHHRYVLGLFYQASNLDLYLEKGLKKIRLIRPEGDRQIWLLYGSQD